jgi:hypothetical protein
MAEPRYRIDDRDLDAVPVRHAFIGVPPSGSVRLDRLPRFGPW